MPVFDTSVLTLVVIAVGAYLFGSVPFGLIWTRMFGLPDPRSIGSGNIGSTNVLRTGSKPAAALTLLSDAFKGLAAVLIGRAVGGEDAAQVAGLAAFLGHLYPVYLSFKGGKGVATFIGIMLALNWMAGLAVCATWLLIAATTRYSSMAALIAAALCTLWLMIFGYGIGFLLGIALTILIYFKHAANISRLRAGREPKIGAS